MVELKSAAKTRKSQKARRKSDPLLPANDVAKNVVDPQSCNNSQGPRNSEKKPNVPRILKEIANHDYKEERKDAATKLNTAMERKLMMDLKEELVEELNAERKRELECAIEGLGGEVQESQEQDSQEEDGQKQDGEKPQIKEHTDIALLLSVWLSQEFSRQQRRAKRDIHHLLDEDLKTDLKEWPTLNALQRYLVPFDDLFFAGTTARWILLEVSAGLDKIPDTVGLTQSAYPYPCRTVWIYNYQNDKISLEPVERIDKVLGTLLHEMVHVYLKAHKCKCEDCEKDPNWCYVDCSGAGHTGHGTAWQELGGWIERKLKLLTAHLKLVGMSHPLFDLDVFSSMERELDIHHKSQCKHPEPSIDPDKSELRSLERIKKHNQSREKLSAPCPPKAGGKKRSDLAPTSKKRKREALSDKQTQTSDDEKASMAKKDTCKGPEDSGGTITLKKSTKATTTP